MRASGISYINIINEMHTVAFRWSHIDNRLFNGYTVLTISKGEMAILQVLTAWLSYIVGQLVRPIHYPLTTLLS